MWRSYLSTALRSFAKNKASLVINLSGLVLGFTSFAVIGLYIHHERSYDAFHVKSDRIYRVTHNEKAGTPPGTRHVANVGPPVGPALKATFPQIEDAVRFRSTPERIVESGDKQFYEGRMFYVDPSVFNIFSFRLAKGDEQTALSLPNNIVVTEEMARKYFGNDDPLGKTLTIDHVTELKVTGVLAPFPDNVHLRFDFLMPFEAFKVPFGYPVTLESWGWISFHTYVLLNPGENAAALQAQLPEFVRAHWPPDRAEKFRMELQPLRDIYLGDVKHETVAGGNKTYLVVLALAGLMILAIAGFNFANLFSAASASRAKEMGVRKVIGARSKSVVVQLLGESLMISVLAALISLLILPLIETLLPSGLHVQVSASAIPYLSAIVVAVAICIGIVGGLYPSFFLSSFNMHSLLKGTFRTGKQGRSIRSGLILAQFSVSIMLVAAVFIVGDQVNYLLTKDPGYTKDELVLLRLPGDQLARRYPSLRNQLLSNSNVTAVSVGGGRMDGDNGSVPIVVEGVTPENGTPMAIDAVTFNFFKTIGITMLSGKEFSETSPADTLNGVIINQSAAQHFGWTPQTAIGKQMRVGNFAGNKEVIGVIPDFHFGPLHNKIAPLVVSYPRTQLQDVYVRFQTSNLSQLIESIRSDWAAVVPDLPFDFVFLSDHLAGLYRSEESFLLLFRLFAVISIAIACLGLYGLISQDIVYRVKEVGIRRVFGASEAGVTFLLLRKFVIIIALANLVAWPICWKLMNQWLSEFSYQQPMNLLIFPLSGILILFIAIGTVGFKTIRAAQANPIKSLRNE